LLLWNLGMAWAAFNSKGEQYKDTWTPPANVQSKPCFPLMCHNLRSANSPVFKSRAES